METISRLTTPEFEALQETKSEKEWNDLCDTIKDKRDGAYPEDWFERVILTGMISFAQQNWV